MIISEKIPRLAVVTGGGQRLGRAAAMELVRLGLDVAVHCRGNRDAAEATAGDIRALGRRAVVVQADLAVEAEVGGVIGTVTAALGPVGVLINNASLFDRDEWDTVTRETWDAHMEPNLRAPFVLMQAMARLLPKDAEGVVINLIDQRVWSLTPHFVTYTLSKAGLWALTQTMALAPAPRTRVNGIGPAPALPSLRQTEEQFANQSASVPLRHG